MSWLDDPNIVTVADMIRMAFKEVDKNTVDFRIIQAILYILARQLNVLKRQVGVKITFVEDEMDPETKLSVTELKFYAKGPRKPTGLEEEGIAHRLLRKALSVRAILKMVEEGEEWSDDAETLREKLLIVGRGKYGYDKHGKPLPRFVTRAQFERLLREMKELEDTLGPIDWATLTIIKKMHEPVKATDSMVALQIAARLENAEKAVDRMEDLLMDIKEKKSAELQQQANQAKASKSVH